ncbi:MAG: Xaa-Pro aminopeptidase [Thermoleophilaceae bacterium]|nr:Xaa-Pro aminopeptidase [Thermoleophilaceae bacterium]
MSRADRVVALLEERELDCLLVTHLVNVRYLAGFTGTNGACVVTRDARLFLTDSRYVEQAKQQVPEFDHLEASRELLGDLAAQLRGRTGFDDAHLSVRAHRLLSEKVPEGVELVPAGGLVERLRAVKEEGELRTIRAAAQLADAAYSELCSAGLAGRTERDVARSIVRFLEDSGADEVSFPPIVAAGAHGALPHAEPRDVEIPRGALVVVDLGARVDGYCSDCTRTLATGPLGERPLEAYEAVRRAQQTALDEVRAGADCQELDAMARELVVSSFGIGFDHGLGHGVGLEVHEGPRLAPSAEGSLEAGNVVTVEPGVYVPGEFGIRIEDLVAVTGDGREVLSGFPKELVTVDG